MSREIPEFLRKHGIRSVTDNVPEGVQVIPSATRFMGFFGNEVREAFTKQPDSQDEPADSAK